MKIQLEKQEAAPLDEETIAAIERAQAQLRRGEGVSLEQAQINARKKYEEWRKTQEVLAA